MVEEMMLLANTTVAEHILRLYPSLSLLRRHPQPTPQQFEPLLQATAAAGFDMDVSSSKV
jgi:exosome complex exonuclease DIS3/RRP44